MGFLLLGVDSLIACFAVGTLVSRSSWVAYATLFGVCDAGGFLLGTAFHWSIPDGTANVVETAVLVGLGRVLARHRAVRASTRRGPVGVGSSVRAEHRQHHLRSDRPRLVSLGGGPGHRAAGLQRAARWYRPPRERRRHARNPGQEAAERYFRLRIRRGRVASSRRRSCLPSANRHGEAFCRDSGQRLPGLEFSHGHRWPVGVGATRRMRSQIRQSPRPTGSVRPRTPSPASTALTGRPLERRPATPQTWPAVVARVVVALVVVAIPLAAPMLTYMARAMIR